MIIFYTSSTSSYITFADSSGSSEITYSHSNISWYTLTLSSTSCIVEDHGTGDKTLYTSYTISNYTGGLSITKSGCTIKAVYYK